MRKILTSLGMVLFAGAVVVGATGAFFSDTETSTGNVFAAGAIDLRIDNDSYAIDCNIPSLNEEQDPPCTGDLVANPDNSWELIDLTIEKFFNFVDLKPGDIGEDTISIHVGSNDAWLCAAARITDDNDNTYTEPEETDDLTTGLDPLLEDGELDNGIEFAFWADDGDNILETDEVADIFLTGPLSGLGEAGQIALADDAGGVLGAGNPVPGGSTFYIGKAWCFGDLTADAEDQDDFGAGDEEAGTPLTRGTGVACNGSAVDNAAQTDVVVGDIQFYAEQARNNPSFLCSGWTPDWPDTELNVTNE